MALGLLSPSKCLKPSDTPPVRYSLEHPDFDFEVGKRLRIFADGVEIKAVVEYDCEAGTVLRVKLDADGLMMLNANREEVERETIRGVVTVEWNDAGAGGGREEKASASETVCERSL